MRRRAERKIAGGRAQPAEDRDVLETIRRLGEDPAYHESRRKAVDIVIQTLGAERVRELGLINPETGYLRGDNVAFDD